MLLFLALIYLLYLVNLSAAALVATKEIGSDIFPDLQFKSCTSQGKDYYDSLDNTCKDCADGMVVDMSTLDAMGNAVQCLCAPGYYKTENNCAADSSGNCKRFTCTACDAGTPASYSDRSACVACDGASGANMGTSDCECATGFALAETDAAGVKLGTKKCVACPSGTQVITTDRTISGQLYKADRYTCQACPSPHMTMDDAFSCTCDAGYAVTGQISVGSQSCIRTEKISEFSSVEVAASLVRYSAETSVSSITIKHYFAKAAAECKYFGGASDIKACQTLANLCALHLFDKSKGPCSTFQAIMSARGGLFTNEILNWNLAMPWLYVSNVQACFSKDYRTQVSLEDQYFRYMVGSYTLDGEFKGYQTLESLFNYCSRKAPFSGQGAGLGSSTSWQVFGATESESYKCDLNSLLKTEQLFYEMFLYDPAGDGASSGYMPVPVRVVNMTNDGGATFVNSLHPQPLCGETDVLVRRFMLLDTVSGISSSTTGSAPDVIRYASDITVEVSLSQENYGIFSPVLSIAYETSQPGLWPAESAAVSANGELNLEPTSRTVTYDFSGRYTMNIESFQEIFYGWGIAAGVFCGLHALYRFNTWITRHSRLNTPGSIQNAGISLETLKELSLFGMSSWVYFFFPIQTLICWYFFTFFKLQGVPSNLLPPTDDVFSSESPYYMFTINIVLMFCFQLAYVLVIVYRQCNSDIFFLDWEPPSGPSDSSRVSVWRSIFVANEWAEMSTMRKIDVKMNLIFLALILIGCGQDYAATQQPNVSDLTPGKTNVILRFANTTFWWILLSVSQWMWKFLFYERFISEPREQQFIDFCTIAKVSILILDEPFHGYYLHCRSPHQHADGTMQELIDMLHKEEAGLTVDRSLTDGPPDVQSFQMFTSGEWKTAFSKIYNNLVRPPSVSEILQTGRKQRGFGATTSRNAAPNRAMSPRADGGGHTSLPNERTVKAWRELTVFLQEFVENNFGKPGLRRMIREPTYWENLANIPPDLNVPEQPNVFFPDRNYNYTSALFLGRELELLLFNITVYSAFDLWMENTAVSIMVTYAFDWCLTYVRETYGAAMVSSKTLIDDRFLM